MSIAGFEWHDEVNRTQAEVPCQNCGKLVTISVPFVGCVFCGECMIADTGWGDGSEDFYEKRRL